MAAARSLQCSNAQRETSKRHGTFPSDDGGEELGALGADVGMVKHC